MSTTFKQVLPIAHINLTYETITLELLLPLLRLCAKKPHLSSCYSFCDFTNTRLSTLLCWILYNHISLYLITPKFLISCWLIFLAFTLKFLALLIYNLMLSIASVSSFVGHALKFLFNFTLHLLLFLFLFPLFLYLNILFCT